MEGLDVDCPKQNVGIRQVGKIVKECRWDSRPTSVPEPEVDIEVQPSAAEGERRKRGRPEPVRPRDETQHVKTTPQRTRFRDVKHARIWFSV